MKKLNLLLLISCLALKAERDITVNTSQGNIAVWDSEGDGPAVMLIHGNSASGKVFKKQFSELGKKYRLIAPDLPGHGNSDSAVDTATYSFLGYAKVLTEVANNLGLEDFTTIGWSLGGHIALEMYLINPNINGILITGTPPIQLSPEGMQKGFKPFEGLHLLGHPETFTHEEAKMFMELGGLNTDKPEDSFLIEDAIKTDGLARKHMFESIGNSIGSDETEIVKDMEVPLAIVAGENDAGINTDYIAKEVAYGNLWKNQVQIIKDAGHAAFWEKPNQFNAIAEEFLNSIKTR